MKLALATSRRSRGRRGFTLSEIMTALGLFGLVVIGLVYSQLLGMRMFNMTATRLAASDSARKVLDLLRDDVRAGKILNVGTGDAEHFTNCLANAPRRGNALQINPSTDTNTYIRYYLDSRSHSLKRVSSDTPGIRVLAPYLTNRIAFIAEDYAGNILTNDQNNRVIKLTLDYYQWEFPVAQVGSGAFYDYYHLQTRIARRAIE